MTDTPPDPTNWKDLIAKYGAWTVLVFYLLGAIPFVKSPIDRFGDMITAAFASHNTEMVVEAVKTRSVLKSICYRLPHNPAAPPCE